MQNPEMLDQIANKKGFIAALDQSGGSTPKALRRYGIDETAYADDEEMFGLMHDMRTRIIKAKAFDGQKIIGAILFERTMDGDIDGVPTATYLWEQCRVVPFLKVDKGLADEKSGVQLMNPMPELDKMCEKAVGKGIFGTKMRSNILAANPDGIAAIVKQQFDKGRAILGHGLMPIIEPEISIKIPDKADAENMLRSEIIRNLDDLPSDKKVMLKVTLPETANHYHVLADHPKVLRVVALSGGYSQEEANARLCENTGMIASFSRALTEGLFVDQPEDAFNATIAKTIDRIYEASCSG